MRPRGVLLFVSLLMVVFVLWKISTSQPFLKESARNIKQSIFGKKAQKSRAVFTALPETSQKCSLSKKCPIDHFAFHIISGAAHAVGPKICFDGEIVMSGVRNNIGKGLNIVLVNGENGKIEDFNYFDMYSGDSKEILEFLKKIKPGMIVLVASFDDPATKLTDEIRDIFVELGSSMIKDVKFRDNWVFVGAAGTKEKSPFEKRTANERETNVYGEWPEMVDIAGCFPKKI